MLFVTKFCLDSYVCRFQLKKNKTSITKLSCWCCFFLKHFLHFLKVIMVCFILVGVLCSEFKKFRQVIQSKTECKDNLLQCELCLNNIIGM